MNYIGSKRKLSQWLIETMSSRCKLDGCSFLDGFGGTSIVSQHMRSRAQVTTVDVELYAYTLAKHYIEGVSDHADLIAELNEAPSKRGFIYTQYCTDRMYWTPENGERIDGIRSAIDEMTLTEDQRAAALVALLEAADAVANTASVYGAYLKHYKATAQRALTLKPIAPAAGAPGVAIHGDILDQQLAGDVAYLDPPYNTRHYGSNYHLLNTISHYQPFNPRGVTGLPDYYKSPFCSKTKAAKALDQLIAQLDYSWIFISYNDEGIVSATQMQDICSKYGQYEVIQTNYQRFKADAKRKQAQQGTVESLHVIRR